MVELKYTLVN